MSRDFLKLGDKPIGVGGRALFTEETLVGREAYLGWPVDAYRIFVPVSGEDGIEGDQNPFERLVISVLAMENALVNSDRMLADMTCLPEDFVHDIVLRLTGKGVICEDRLRLTSDFRAKYLKAKANSDEIEATELQTAFVFRDAVTGRMLPNIKLLGDKPIETLDYDTVAKRRPIMIRRAQQTFPPPNAKDVRRVIADMRRRGRDYGGVINIPSYARCDIIEAPEQYYLLCPIGVRRSDGEERIGDPFGMGYSLVLEAAFEQALADDNRLLEKITEWKSRLEQSDDELNEKASEKQLPYNGKHIESAYPHLASALRLAYTRNNIRDLYAALEWGFYYHLAEDAQAIVLSVNSMSASEFTKAVNHTLARLGWENQRAPSVKPVPGKIIDFETGRNTEFPVTLAIMLACEGGKGTLLDRLNKEFGAGFLKKMFAMRELRDTKRHGAKLDRSQDIAFDEVRPFAEKVLRLTLSDIQFAEGAVLPTDNDAKTDEKLKATNDLHAIYGRKAVREFPGEVKEHLLEAQKEWNKTGAEDNVVDAVVEVGAAMQAMLVHVLGDYSAPKVENAVKAAKCRALGAGFSDFPEDVYGGIKPDRIRNGLRGQISTLGVAGVILALCADEDSLSAVAGRMPELFAFIAEAHHVSGHGGKSVFLDDDQRRAWQKSVKKFIETLMEVYNG